MIHDNRGFLIIALLIFRVKYIHFILASFPNRTVSPTVESVLIDGPTYQIPNAESTPSLLPVFRCNFDDVSDGTYAYDVYWYINGNSLTAYKNCAFSNIDTTVLRGSDWTHSYNMNMEVALFKNVHLIREYLNQSNNCFFML